MDTALKILQGYESVSLEELDRVALLDRHDTKYVFSYRDLDSVLTALAPQYRVLEVNGFRISPYETLYYDTDDLEYYTLHQRGKRNRLKVRMRKYCSTGVTFLEVKYKTNKNRTIKYRKEIDDIRYDLLPEDIQFIEECCGTPPPLQPRIFNSFERITLAHLNSDERLTIDRYLSFSDLKNNQEELPKLIIAELKQAEFDRESIFARFAKKHLIRPDSVSKYCLGVGLLYEQARKNFINMKLRRIRMLETKYQPTNL